MLSYSVSIPFERFCKATTPRDNSLQENKTFSVFIREMLFQSIDICQLLHFEIPTDKFFDQSLWYTITRAIRSSLIKLISFWQSIITSINSQPLF
ncbi:hypothetical protein AB4K20DRAFT_1889679 [Rhizopus microsporus]